MPLQTFSKPLKSGGLCWMQISKTLYASSERITPEGPMLRIIRCSRGQISYYCLGNEAILFLIYRISDNIYWGNHVVQCLGDCHLSCDNILSLEYSAPQNSKLIQHCEMHILPVPAYGSIYYVRNHCLWITVDCCIRHCSAQAAAMHELWERPVIWLTWYYHVSIDISAEFVLGHALLFTMFFRM